MSSNETSEIDKQRVVSVLRFYTITRRVWATWCICFTLMLMFATTSEQLQNYMFYCIIGTFMYIFTRCGNLFFTRANVKVIDDILLHQKQRFTPFTTGQWFYDVGKMTAVLLLIPSIIFLTS